ncbi:MAG: lytic murein transglycosylase [Xanthobacteraceae bacterium]
MLAQYAEAFAAVEKAYGVDRYIIAAIWGWNRITASMGGGRSCGRRRPPLCVRPAGKTIFATSS